MSDEIAKICEIHGPINWADIGSGLRCNLCRQEWQLNDRAENREKYREYSKKHRQKIGEYRNVVEISRRRNITSKEYLLMFEKQDHKCAICSLPERKKNRKGEIARLTLDHNHQTKKNRELLCHTCNLAIGLFEENIERIQSAVLYLKGGK